MKAMRITRSIVLLAMVAAMLTLPRCHLLCPFKSTTTEISSYMCTANVVEYTRDYPRPGIIKITNHRSGKSNLTQFLNPPTFKPPNFYVDALFKPASDYTIAALLSSTWLLQVSRTDALFDGQKFLEVELTSDIKQLIIGFDTRATQLPEWLTRKFEKIPGIVVRSTEKYKYRPPKPTGPATANVEYALYTPRSQYKSAFSKKFTLGGNNVPGVKWRDVPQADDKARETGSQYLVFLRPKAVVKKIQSRVIDTIQIEVCKQEKDTAKDVLAAAKAHKAAALDWWFKLDASNNQYKQAKADGALEIVFGTGPCREVTDAPVNAKVYKVCGKAADIGKSTKTQNSWPLRSSASLDPAATKITVQLRGNKVTGPARGKLSFRVTEENKLEIGELTLFAGPLKVSGIEMAWITVGQKQTLIADCDDALPPGPFRLCNKYVLPVGRAAVGSAALIRIPPIAETKVFIPLNNNKPIPIQVDFNKREFTMSGGPIHSEIEADHERFEVDVWLDIHTPFNNIAPIASFEEMNTRYKCIDNSQAVVTLDASASTDDDPGAGIVSYLWLEDAGLPGERILGKVEKLSILMNFGSHKVTLIVTDQQGATDSKTVIVEVYDSKLDYYQAPPDAFAQQTDRTTQVNIGTGTASDGCSGAAESLNNAPARHLFPPGFTPVEWTFHDFNGNYAYHQQKVFVVPPAYYPPPMASSSIIWNKGTGGAIVSLTYNYNTKTQGQQMRANEYILLSSPSGKIFSFKDSGQIVEGLRHVVPHSINEVFGKFDTHGSLQIKRVNAVFSEKGIYAFTYILTQPRSDSDDPRGFVAYDRLEFNNETKP